jgi:hypothetical protein
MINAEIGLWRRKLIDQRQKVCAMESTLQAENNDSTKSGTPIPCLTKKALLSSRYARESKDEVGLGGSTKLASASASSVPTHCVGFYQLTLISEQFLSYRAIVSTKTFIHCHSSQYGSLPLSVINAVVSQQLDTTHILQITAQTTWLTGEIYFSKPSQTNQKVG